MIKNIEIDSLDVSEEFSYAQKLAFFENRKQIQFQPGLNILFGPNGCGKSTILRMIALSLAAEQGGVSTITSTWVSALRKIRGNGSKLDGIKVNHDGQPIKYGNPRNAVGLFAGGAAFDDDFFNQGLKETQSRDSTGWTTMRRNIQMIAALSGEAPFPESMNWRIGRERVPEALMDLLAPTIGQGQRTMLFDEPESGLAIPVQRNVMNKLFGAAKEQKFQVIVATHSPFALGLPGANYIEIEEGYLKESEATLELAVLQLRLMRELAGAKE